MTNLEYLHKLYIYIYYMDNLYNSNDLKKVFLFCLVFIIIYYIEMLNNYNNIIFSFVPAIPIIKKTSKKIVKNISKK